LLRRIASGDKATPLGRRVEPGVEFGVMLGGVELVVPLGVELAAISSLGLEGDNPAPAKRPEIRSFVGSLKPVSSNSKTFAGSAGSAVGVD
jgi:hypothetical protein